MYEVSPQHYIVWLWTGVRRPANKRFLAWICVNKKCKLTKNRFYCLLPAVPSLFHPWALTTCFLFHSLPRALFLSISSRLPPLFFLTIPHPLSLSSSILLDMAPRFLPLSLTAIHSINPIFLWLVLVISYLCSERFMLSYFSDQLLKLGPMLSKKTERKDKTKTSRKPLRIKWFFQE